MIARFAVDFDGTLVEDDHYPAIGAWLPGATAGLNALERIGRVVVWSCRTANAHHLTEEPRDQDAVDAEIARMGDVLSENGFGHLEIWTKSYKPPAAAYIDNKAVAFRGDWEQAIEDTLDLIAPIGGGLLSKEPVQKLLEEPRERDGICCGDCDRCNLWPDNIFTGTIVKPREHVDEDCWCGPKTVAINPYSRHPSSQRFHEVLNELGTLHDLKSVGYGTDDDPLANVRSSEDWGIPGWQGAMIRACDKIKRLQAYAQKGDLPFEAIEDAFRDLAVYAVIGLVLFEQDQS